MKLAVQIAAAIISISLIVTIAGTAVLITDSYLARTH